MTTRRALWRRGWGGLAMAVALVAVLATGRGAPAAGAAALTAPGTPATAAGSARIASAALALAGRSCPPLTDPASPQTVKVGGAALAALPADAAIPGTAVTMRELRAGTAPPPPQASPLAAGQLALTDTAAAGPLISSELFGTPEADWFTTPCTVAQTTAFYAAVLSQAPWSGAFAAASTGVAAGSFVANTDFGAVAAFIAAAPPPRTAPAGAGAVVEVLSQRRLPLGASQGSTPAITSVETSSGETTGGGVAGAPAAAPAAGAQVTTTSTGGGIASSTTAASTSGAASSLAGGAAPAAPTVAAPAAPAVPTVAAPAVPTVVVPTAPSAAGPSAPTPAPAATVGIPAVPTVAAPAPAVPTVAPAAVPTVAGPAGPSTEPASAPTIAPPPNLPAVPTVAPPAS